MLQIRPRRTALMLTIAAFLLMPAAARLAGAQTQPAAEIPGWVLVWNDEFNGPDGSGPDPAKWTIVTGGDGFGNNELEYYTARTENIHQEDGNLIITARKEDYTGPDGVARNYTSARIETKGHFETRYGRLEARMKIPRGQGMWPAFWAMGTNFDRVGWPDCGEMDIMENIGREPNVVHGSLHGPGYSGEEPLTGAYTLPHGAPVADDFHIFAVEWDPNTVRFYVDGVLTETKSASDVPGKPWAFNHPFFILFNLAVGGNWPGNPDAHTEFPARMVVDYVRVYKRTEGATSTAAR
ncbi:MAG TPA: glycoside hydrolase family 16 protein [Terracidiphilus sp.]|nr:glycoside hydrolase family 16 protein [Terracidiphilus sp.]